MPSFSYMYVSALIPMRNMRILYDSTFVAPTHGDGS